MDYGQAFYDDKATAKRERTAIVDRVDFKKTKEELYDDETQAIFK